MAHILRRLPFGQRTIAFREQTFRTREDQIIVWVSVDMPDSSIWNPANARFPAILDSGNSHNLLLTRQQTIQWTGFHPESFDRQKAIRLGATTIPQLRANVWLHSNQLGKRDVFSAQPPFLLNCPNGIVICADDHPQAPRLPLLGLRALVRNELVLTIDGAQKCVHLGTSSPWWWPF
jgi:hypothetical protein